MRAALATLLLASACNLVFGVDPGAGGADAARGDAPAAGSKRWSRVVAGLNHTCAIDEAAALWCWGENISGQLGDRSYGPRSRPTQVEPGTTWKQVSLGVFHTCGVQMNDSLWCWGSDSSGQLGISSTAAQPRPVAVSAGAAGVVSWKAVAAGSFYTVAVATDGTMWSWGADSFGQLGTGLLAPTGGVILQDQPTQITGTDYDQVAAGPLHACATQTTGALWCWGLGSTGQLGRGGNTSSTVPVPAAAATALSWSEVGVGNAHTCARTTAGEIWCWGFDEVGQVGQGQGAGSRPPGQVLAVASTLAVGGRHTCALDEAGLLWCWGDADHGRLALDRDQPVLTPSSVVPDRRWAAASSGATHSCAIDAGDATLWCTGNNGAAQLGVGSGGPMPEPLALGRSASSLSVGAGHGCLIEGAGAVACWGDNSDGQVGDGTNRARAAPTPVTGATAGALSLGDDTSCLIDRATPPALWCWGDGGSGQLGQDDTSDSARPLRVATSATGWQQVDTGRHSCGLEHGDLSCWGRHDEGQLGNAADANVPRIVASMINDVSTGGTHTCAVRSNTQIACWGRNSDGQLGTTPEVGGPAAVTVQAQGAPLTGSAIYAGEAFTCALDGTQQAWCWGRNSRGQLGRAASTTGAPARTDSNQPWAHLALGREHACGVTVDSGELYCWGSNTYGQLGLGPGMAIQVPAPTRVGTATWKRVVAGFEFTCGIQTDDSVWCWGRNEQGQLGDGQSQRLGFVPVPDPPPP